jgi:hypothetical protein
MSAIKRDCGVKDFGSTVEGHGRILDRMDSICFSAPLFSSHAMDICISAFHLVSLMTSSLLQGETMCYSPALS